jgi:hypothetical protein
MVFKNYRKTNREIRVSFKTIVLHLGTVNSNKERKPIGKTYSLVKHSVADPDPASYSDGDPC